MSKQSIFNYYNEINEAPAHYIATPFKATITPILHSKHIKSLQCQASEKITNLLTNIVQKESPKSIRFYVAQQALKCKTPESFFHDLLEYGCTITMIMKAMKTTDESQFFNNHYSEIDLIRHRMDNIGIFYQSWSEQPVWLSRVAVEAVAFHMTDELGIEIDRWHLSPMEVSPKALNIRQPLTYKTT